ncbi:MAG: patatin-like phospholipase family protein, partial [Candidatus Binatia bacterium]
MSGQTTNQQFGLALSGGGFRASLYHLGVIRFLREAHILPSISTITSVSGGSIIAAHLVLNWERYCGTEEAFQEAADELLHFVRMDVRNRIVRRFPLLAVVNVLRRLLLQGSARRLGRTGLLERHYEEFLYGDTGLMQLPDSPRLYILATNLSEGSLCAFCREGLLLQRRSVADNSIEVQTVHMGLATVSMAVAASSAFPGFFPPLDLSYKDVGATEGEFPQHAFTDGGIYDNLGLRMFRYLQGQIGSAQARGEANRLMGTTELDGVLVSDAGATLKVRSGSSGGGLLRTAIRSSDILMDRVYQLELGTFADTDKVAFFPITRLVEPTQDRTAMHPEVQRQTALIRTDMDRFTELEISTLVQHGYCVARQVVRELPSFTRYDIPEGPPWDPSASQESVQGVRTDSLGEPAVALPVARMLQRSSNRRVVSTLFHSRDWPTYVWLPLIFLTVFGVPFIVYDARKTAIQQQQVLSALAQSSPLYADVLEFLDQKRPDPIAPIRFEQVDSVEPLDFTGYDVVSDDRVYDLRGWTSGEHPRYPARMHARFRMLRTEAAKDRPVLRIQLPSDQEEMHA